MAGRSKNGTTVTFNLHQWFEDIKLKDIPNTKRENDLLQFRTIWMLKNQSKAIKTGLAANVRCSTLIR